MSEFSKFKKINKKYFKLYIFNNNRFNEDYNTKDNIWKIIEKKKILFESKTFEINLLLKLKNDNDNNLLSSLNNNDIIL